MRASENCDIGSRGSLVGQSGQILRRAIESCVRALGTPAIAPRAATFEPLEGRRLLTVAILDNTEAWFSVTGTWDQAGGGYGAGGLVRFAAAGDGSQTAAWTFMGVQSGVYRVAANWAAFSNNVESIVNGLIRLRRSSLRSRDSLAIRSSIDLANAGFMNRSNARHSSGGLALRGVVIRRLVETNVRQPRQRIGEQRLDPAKALFLMLAKHQTSEELRLGEVLSTESAELRRQHLPGELVSQLQHLPWRLTGDHPA